VLPPGGFIIYYIQGYSRCPAVSQKVVSCDRWK